MTVDQMWDAHGEWVYDKYRLRRTNERKPDAFSGDVRAIFAYQRTQRDPAVEAMGQDEGRWVLLHDGTRVWFPPGVDRLFT